MTSIAAGAGLPASGSMFLASSLRNGVRVLRTISPAGGALLNHADLCTAGHGIDAFGRSVFFGEP